jgi:TatD DNase family protein
MLKLEKDFPADVFLMMGLHPTSVKENYLEELAHVKEWIDQKKFFAIGEIGIDLYWDRNFLSQQQEAFKTQIKWAKEKNLPIVIHCRDAFDEIFEILEHEKGDSLRGIFHCFTGTKEQALQAISYNMKLGIGGVATFKNGMINKFLNEIDLQHIVLETDAPYLAPTPYRGKRNESAYITNVVDKLVDIYGLSFKEVAEITTQNSKDIFGI